MMQSQYVKRNSVKNYFPLPNAIFSLGLHPTEIAVYAYLMSIEDRQTYQCVTSYSTIAEKVGISLNTVAKYVGKLEEHGLIRTEHTHSYPLRGSLHRTAYTLQSGRGCYPDAGAAASRNHRNTDARP